MHTRFVESPLVHRSDTVRANGRIVEVDHLIVATEAWEARSEASDAAWIVIPFGQVVIAYRVRA